MGKAAKQEKNRRLNGGGPGTSPPAPDAAPMAQPAVAPDGRQPTAQELFNMLEDCKRQLLATREQRNAYMNQSAELISKLNDQSAAIQHLNVLIGKKDERIAELEQAAKPAALPPVPAKASGKNEPATNPQ